MGEEPELEGRDEENDKERTIDTGKWRGRGGKNERQGETESRREGMGRRQKGGNGKTLVKHSASLVEKAGTDMHM